MAADKGTPHRPFYKDERIIGKTITVNVSVRVFVASVTIAGLLFGWAMLLVLRDDRNLHDYLTRAHASRLADQRATQQEIDQLACYIVADIKDSAAPIVPKVRHQYGCPPYGKDPNFNLYKPSKKIPARTAATHASGSPSSRASSSRSSRSSTGPRAGEHPPVSSHPSSPSRPSGSPTVSSPPSSHPSPGKTPIVSVPVRVPPIITTGPIRIGGTCAVQVGRTCVVAE